MLALLALRGWTTSFLPVPGEGLLSVLLLSYLGFSQKQALTKGSGVSHTRGERNTYRGIVKQDREGKTTGGGLIEPAILRAPEARYPRGALETSLGQSYPQGWEG